jgi:uncharacterized protein (TIRG00374 family)
MTQRTHETRAGWWSRPAVRIGLAVLGLLVVSVVAARAVDLAELWRLLSTASPWWLLAALGFKLATPLGTATLYARVLRLLGHRRRAVSLWLPAQVAIVVTMAFPAGPLAMSAFLLRVLRRRGVPEGVTTLAVAIDTLTYEVAFLGLVTVGLGYLFTHGALSVGQISEVGLVALAVVVGGLYLWGLQRDRADLTRKLVGAQQWLAGRLRAPWQAESIEGFLDELYRGKALVAQRPYEFARLIVLQVGVLALDVMTLYSALRALGHDPHLSVVILSYSLASLFAVITPLPGGGGSFEATVALSATRLGVTSEVALGATLIYRVLAFWLPALLSAATYRTLLGGAPARAGAHRQDPDSAH